MSCSSCDCTGDVHSIDGQWRGVCNLCRNGECPDCKPKRTTRSEQAFLLLLHLTLAAMCVTMPTWMAHSAAILLTISLPAAAVGYWMCTRERPGGRTLAQVSFFLIAYNLGVFMLSMFFSVALA